MSHRHARLTPFARRLIVERVQEGQPVAHVAKAMGVSRQCAHRWINRFNEAGDDGLEDRSSHDPGSRTPTTPDLARRTSSNDNPDRPPGPPRDRRARRLAPDATD